MAHNATARFSNRVADYIKYRPGYPSTVIDLLERQCGLSTSSTIADIGSGTGLLAELFLKHGNTVFGVEPNAEMRAAGEKLLIAYANFVSVEGEAEATALPSASIDFVTAGQAFHWFDRPRAKAEFTRILRGSGWVVLIWNDRRTDSTPFLRDYEALLQHYGTDYQAVDHKNIDDKVLGDFFGARGYYSASFDNVQIFDYDGLAGRLRSSSYVPAPDDPRFAAMITALKTCFAKHEREGKVSVEYDTRVFYGQHG